MRKMGLKRGVSNTFLTLCKMSEKIMSEKIKINRKKINSHSDIYSYIILYRHTNLHKKNDPFGAEPRVTFLNEY